MPKSTNHCACGTWDGGRYRPPSPTHSIGGYPRLLATVMTSVTMAMCLASCADTPTKSTHTASPITAATSLSTTAAPPNSSPQWLYRLPGETGVFHPVSWLDGSLEPVLTAPKYPGSAGGDLWPSPDGRLLIDQQTDGVDQVIDWTGHRFARLSNRPFYQWSDDGRHFCATADVDSKHVDLELIDLISGATEHIARVSRSLTGGTIRPRSCSLQSGLSVLTEERLSPRGPLVSTIFAYQLSSGKLVASYDYHSAPMSFANVAPDSSAFSISDRTHALPAIVRETVTGRTILTIPNRWVIAVGTQHLGYLTVGQVSGSAGEQIVELRDRSGTVKWSRTGDVDVLLTSPVDTGFVIQLFPHGPGTESEFEFVRPDGVAKTIVSGARGV